MVIGIIGIVLIFILIVLGMPVAFSLFLVSFAGISILQNFDLANTIMVLNPMGVMSGAEMPTLPLFILLGSFALASGVVQDAFEAARRWMGRLPGSLGLTTIAASAFFAACSGSSVAGMVLMTKMVLPEMRKANYSEGLSCGTCLAGGLLAPIIPPSGPLVIYGLAAGQPIAHLLIAGVLPGILLTVFFGAGVYLVAKLNPISAPVTGRSFPWKERVASIWKMWGVTVIFSVIFWGIFLGIFTAMEAAALGCFVALVQMVARRRGESWRAFIEACWDCALIATMLFFLIISASMFTNFIVLAGLPKALVAFLIGLNLPAYGIIALILLIYIVLGMFIEGLSMLLITIPIFLPVVTALGYDGIWFGIIAVMMMEIGVLTPPMGMLVYQMSGLVSDIPVTTIFKGAQMFVGIEFLVVVLICIFPQIAIWLPSQMMGY